MSYAIRNTLILLIVLGLMGGGSWAYLHYVQESKIDELNKKLTAKQQDLKTKNQIANQYPKVQEKFQQAQKLYNNMDKVLISTRNPNRIFYFLNEINRGKSSIVMNYTFRDSTINDQYGILTSGIEGSGNYRMVNNYLRNIEYNKPLNKIVNLNISPKSDTPEKRDVNFDFVLKSYYDRASIFEQHANRLSNQAFTIAYNPFFPLLRQIQPNEDNLPDVESSSLTGVSKKAVFLVDQNGKLQTLKVGDEVYLGKLTHINLEDRSATFSLNKGGIMEKVTLEVEQ